MRTTTTQGVPLFETMQIRLISENYSIIMSGYFLTVSDGKEPTKRFLIEGRTTKYCTYSFYLVGFIRPVYV